MLIYYLPLSLSMVGCTLNLIAISFFNNLHNCQTLRQMIICFTSSDLILFTSYLFMHVLFGDSAFDISHFDLPNLITFIIIHAGIYFGLITSQLWTCWLAQYLNCYGNGTFEEKWLIKYKATSYFMGIIAVVAVISLDVIEVFRGRSVTIELWFNVAIALAIFLCFVFSLKSYLSGIYRVWKRRDSIPWLLLIYPLVAIAVPMPKILVSIFCTLTNSCGDNKWIHLRALFYLQGFLNALAYGLISLISQLCATLKRRSNRLLSQACDGIDIISYCDKADSLYKSRNITRKTTADSLRDFEVDSGVDGDDDLKASYFSMPRHRSTL